MTPAEEGRWRALVESIRANLAAIDKQLKAINENTKSNKGQKEIEPSKVAISEVQLPVAISEYYKAENENRKCKMASMALEGS